MQSDYYGRTELPSFWPAVAASTQWNALKTLNSVVGGAVVGKVMDVLGFAMTLADNTNDQYDAIGVGKASFDVDGTTYGTGNDHEAVHAEAFLWLLNDWCYPYSQTASGPPTMSLPGAPPGSHTSADAGGSTVLVEEAYEEGVARDINTGFGFEFKTKATYAWQYKHYSFPYYFWSAGGIDVTDPKIQLYNWDITPTGSFEIIGLVP